MRMGQGVWQWGCGGVGMDTSKQSLSACRKGHRRNAAFEALPAQMPMSLVSPAISHPSQVLVQAGAYVKDDACRALILLVVNAAQLHAYAARASYRALTANLAAAQPSLLMVATWCLGEGRGEYWVGWARELPPFRPAWLLCYWSAA